MARTRSPADLLSVCSQFIGVAVKVLRCFMAGSYPVAQYSFIRGTNVHPHYHVINIHVSVSTDIQKDYRGEGSIVCQMYWCPFQKVSRLFIELFLCGLQSPHIPLAARLSRVYDSSASQPSNFMVLWIYN